MPCADLPYFYSFKASNPVLMATNPIPRLQLNSSYYLASQLSPQRVIFYPPIPAVPTLLRPPHTLSITLFKHLSPSLLLCITLLHNQTHCIYIQFQYPLCESSSAMAAVSFSKVLAVFVAVMVAVSAVSAQEVSPAPSPDKGGASSLPVTGAVLVSSLVVSLSALIKH